MTKILIVDDEKHIRFILRELLEEENNKVYEAKNGMEALTFVRKYSPEIILLDFKLPDYLGDKIIKKIKEIDNKTKIIIITAYADVKKAVTCMKYGAYDYLTKPFNNNEILFVVKKAIKEFQLENQVEELKKKIAKNQFAQQMVGESLAIKKVISQIELVAPTDISVLIEGETGTGKEIVAKMIHTLSKRNNKPFIAVDCGAIPENLFESEIFGYEKGAFTGASKTHSGKFELANEGTLFLDEITNLPSAMQPKLLRVLQEKKIVHLGGKKEIDINVRVISATNKNIEHLIKKGEFRDDLFYRINEYKIVLPPLRERKEDIPILINMFIKEFNIEFNKKIKSVDKNALKMMYEYNWPGNVRELRNIIKRAVLTAKGDSITKDNILFLNNNKISQTKLSSFNEIENNSLLNKVKIIKKAIIDANGNKSLAAKRLGISRIQLYRILQKAKNNNIDV